MTFARMWLQGMTHWPSMAKRLSQSSQPPTRTNTGGAQLTVAKPLSPTSLRSRLDAIFTYLPRVWKALQVRCVLHLGIGTHCNTRC